MSENDPPSAESDLAPSPNSQSIGAPSGQLPPVQPPSPGFLIQLFVVPMVIVTAVVMVCLMFNWLAHMGTNPEDLVDDLTRLNPGSWQKALTLANLLCDRHQAEARRDPLLARRLADVLDEQLAAGSFDPERVKLRAYLAMALGIVEADPGIESLKQAVLTQRDPVEMEVQRTALAAIARRADFLGADRVRLQRHPGLIDAITLATQSPDTPDPSGAASLLRAQATYTLAVVGGEEASRRLTALMRDADPIVRYNAVTGLARMGNDQAIPGLLRMLDLAQIRKEISTLGGTVTASQPQTTPVSLPTTGDASTSTDELVTRIARNATIAAGHLAKKNPNADLSEVQRAIRNLIDNPHLPSHVQRGLKTEARAVLELLDQVHRVDSVDK